MVEEEIVYDGRDGRDPRDRREQRDQRESPRGNTSGGKKVPPSRAF